MAGWHLTMGRAARVVLVLLLLPAFALGGCTSGATTTTSDHGLSAVVVAAESGSDVGNERPQVTYDGLMVRRRVALAIHPTPTGDLVTLRHEMDGAAARLLTTLTTISPSALDPALLEHLAPEVTVLLPSGSTIADARKLLDPASSGGRRFPEVEGYEVASVLVHDLRFTVRSTEPAVVAGAIDREGILSDALGNYTTSLGHGFLEIAYTGPLLSDNTIESVRGGIARRARVKSAEVIVSSRSSTGAGVDMAKEPVRAPAVTEISTAHQHGTGLP